VVNSPARVTHGILSVRERLTALARSPIRSQARIALDTLKLRAQSYYRARAEGMGSAPADRLSAPPDFLQSTLEWEAKARAVGDPTTLILIDEADRLRTDSLEQVRSIFDEGGIGLVLIGMPGLEKRMARYPQLYSRIGFVHEFHPLDAAEMRRLLHRHWTPRGVTLPAEAWSEEAVAAILRITGGNFRLLNRL
jgi:type II secretory pathway predicted ATPase ExeA